MGRLTWRDENGKAWFKSLDPDCGGCEFTDERCQHHAEIAADRLAAYEETGLEPEKIKTCMEELTDYRESGAGPFLCKCMKEFIDKLDGSSQEHILDLLQAEKDGRVRILPKGEGGTCGGCGHFKRIPGKRCGTCEVRPYCTDSRGCIDAHRGTFTPSQSRKCCKQYIPREEAEVGRRKENTNVQGN